ncbi:MAG: antitoxin Xre/MbcA/ParS toxin-binding domain-containing protein [Amphritea sp.]
MEILSESEYTAALKRIDALMDSPLESPEGDELGVLVALVEAYEARHYPIDTATPIEAIRFRLDQLGLGGSAEKVLEAAIALFEGDADAARHWLEQPALGLGERRPVDVMNTAAGREALYLLIQRLRHGSLP